MTKRINLVSQSLQDKRKFRCALHAWGLVTIAVGCVLLVDAGMLWQESHRLVPLLDSQRVIAGPIGDLMERHQTLQVSQQLLSGRHLVIQQALLPDATLQTMGAVTRAVGKAGKEYVAIDSMEIRFGEDQKTRFDTRLRLRARSTDDSHAAILVNGLKQNDRLAEVTLQSAVSERESQVRLLEIVAVPFSPRRIGTDESAK